MLRRPGNIPNKVLIAAAALSLTAVTTGISPAASAAGRPPGPGAGVSAAQVSPRSAVPWRRVGPGWVLAQYWPGRFFYQSKPKAAPVSLYLISPGGHRYLLRRLAATKKPRSLVDWSGDKTRALQFDSLSGRLEQLTLSTGRISHISPPRQVSWFTLGYTRPAGQGLLAFRHVHGGSQVVRLSLSGRLVKVLASGPHDGTAVYSASGATIAVGGAKGIQLVSASGGVIRRLPVPRTGSSGCFPARWWNSRTILASCVARGARRDRLWLVPASGARPTPLTPQHGPHSPDPGDFGAWATPGGLYLQAVTSSGSVLIFRQRANGAVQAIKVPGSARLNWIASTRGSRLLINQESPCAATDSLLWFNPATAREQYLIKAPRGRAGLLGFAAYGPPVADILFTEVCPAGRAIRILSSPDLSSPGLSSPGASRFAPGLPRT